MEFLFSAGDCVSEKLLVDHADVYLAAMPFKDQSKVRGIFKSSCWQQEYNADLPLKRLSSQAKQVPIC